MNRSRLRALALTASIAVGLGLTACGAENTEDPTEPVSTGSAAESPGAEESPTPSESTAPNTAPSFLTGTLQGKGGSGAVVTKIRVAGHEGYDRVVVDFQGKSAPAWRTSWVKAFVQDGSGEPVAIRGRANLALVLQAAGHDENYDPVFTGPQLARPRLQTLKAWAVTGDFEGQFSLGFALNAKAPYRVFALKNPTRLVIDFQHAS